MTDAPAARQPNRLIHEVSPYLRQHAHNPVDWYPWGEEALERARAEDRLILLSIGYSACHWCHVMERESFENEAIARIMNASYVNIKVDREERPDLDDVYMAATVSMNHGQGGWPMTVILTPALDPVFAGTYFPPEDRGGRPGLGRLLREIAEAWEQDRDDLARRAARFTEQLRQRHTPGPPGRVGADVLRVAADQYRAVFDAEYGGFGTAPKFPPSTGLMLLLRLHRRFGDPDLLAMVRTTLDAMVRGGIYDHIGGGLSRYATDRRWLVPHFEKMLYDNALLVRVLLEAWQVTGEPRYRQVVDETLTWVLREMTHPDGGFYSSTDADSEGGEGRFFVWQPEEVLAVLGEDDARLFARCYDVTRQGNWEGTNILHLADAPDALADELGMAPETLEASLRDLRERLRVARERRPAPPLDDKVLTAWNGLMIGAMAEAWRVLGDPRYREGAERAAEFMASRLEVDGVLRRAERAGVARVPAFLEDHAWLADGLLALYEATGEARWLDAATRHAEITVKEFGGEDDGAFFQTGPRHERLALRYREGADGAMPSPNAVAASVLIRLAHHLDRPAWRERGVRAIRAYGDVIDAMPRAFASSLLVLDYLLEGPTELVLVGDPTDEQTEALRAAIGRRFLPNRVVVSGLPGSAAADSHRLLRERTAVAGATLYVCRDGVCGRPVNKPDELDGALAALPPSGAPSGAGPLSVRRPGRATADGTTRYAARFSATGYRPLADTGLVASAVGFGGYRIDDETPEHREALTRALLCGVNLIDTSTNYMDGGSERLIGAVLRDLEGAGDIRRDEVVVVSKIGYVQGATARQVRARAQAGRPFADIVEISNGLGHCIHPDFLADQLERSLDRLELETLDVCLLHNPEYYLRYGARDRSDADRQAEFARRLEVAFGALEEAVAAGRVGVYGVSSNTLAAPPGTVDGTSLEMMLQAARAAGGAHHHFRVLELPLNLFESDAALTPSLGDPPRETVLAAARRQGVGVLVNRPLNAFVRREMVRLGDFIVSEQGIDLAGRLRELEDAEALYRSEIAPAVSVPDDAVPPADYFNQGRRLSMLADQAIGIEQWTQLDYEVRSTVGRAAGVLDGSLAGVTAERWRAWRPRYVAILTEVLTEMRRRALVLAAARSAAIGRAIDPVFPEGRRNATLSRKAIWTVASTPGVSTVLVGMRTPAYVEDALEVLTWAPLPDPDEIYGAVRAAPYLDDV